MEENTEKLVVSFEASISSDICDTVGDLAEVGLDAVMDDGILKDIPILSTVVGLYRIGHTIRERHAIKQLALFVTELNRGSVDESRRKQLIEKLNGDTRKSKQEIEYILVVLDSYLEYEKPRMLAKLYIAYLEETITWATFAEYSSMVNRLIPGDTELLKERHVVRKQSQCAELLRLSSLGLMYQQDSPLFPDGDYTTIKNAMASFTITDFGDKFTSIISDKVWGGSYEPRILRKRPCPKQCGQPAAKRFRLGSRAGLQFRKAGAGRDIGPHQL